MDLILVALGLGIAGIDIFGIVVIVAALSAGASKRAILTFATTVFIGTVILGTALSLLLGSSVGRITEYIQELPDVIWVCANLLAALLLLVWATKRLIKYIKHRKQPKQKSSFDKWLKYGLFIVGVWFAVCALTDPSFLALIAISGNNDGVVGIVIAHALWILVSQAPLFIFATAVKFDKHKPLMKKIEKAKKRYSRRTSLLLTAIVALAAAAFIINLTAYLITSEWLWK